MNQKRVTTHLVRLQGTCCCTRIHLDLAPSCARAAHWALEPNSPTLGRKELRLAKDSLSLKGFERSAKQLMQAGTETVWELQDNHAGPCNSNLPGLLVVFFFCCPHHGCSPRLEDDGYRQYLTYLYCYPKTADSGLRNVGCRQHFPAYARVPSVTRAIWLRSSQLHPLGEVCPVKEVPRSATSRINLRSWKFRSPQRAKKSCVACYARPA